MVRATRSFTRDSSSGFCSPRGRRLWSLTRALVRGPTGTCRPDKEYPYLPNWRKLWVYNGVQMGISFDTSFWGQRRPQLWFSGQGCHSSGFPPSRCSIRGQPEQGATKHAAKPAPEGLVDLAVMLRSFNSQRHPEATKTSQFPMYSRRSPCRSR